MPCNACAPCTTVWECRANKSKNRSSLGKKARNHCSIWVHPLVHEMADRATRHIIVINHFWGKVAGKERNPFIHCFAGYSPDAAQHATSVWGGKLLRATGGNNARSRRSSRGGTSARRSQRSRPGSPPPIAQSRPDNAAWR